MNANNLVKEIFTDLELGHFEKASGLLSDNFRSTVLGKEVNRTVYISTYRALLQGIPDMTIKVSEVKASGDKLTAKVLMSGTNDRPIPSLMHGWQQIPATHKKLEGVIADLEFTVDGERIRQIKNRNQKEGMFYKLLESLGVDYQKVQKN